MVGAAITAKHALPELAKKRLGEINQQLAQLTTRFSQNQLGDEEQDVLVIDDVAGLAYFELNGFSDTILHVTAKAPSAPKK